MMHTSRVTASNSRCMHATCSQRVSAVRLHLAPALPTARKSWQQQDSRMLSQPLLTWPALQQPARQQLCCRAVSSSDNSGDSSSSSQQSQSGRSALNWFDRLPPKVQLTAMGALLFAGMVS
eukprot:GHUV01017353.1.p2 GENE.GHUV01017353.1~~GHUV01017353.1.p2  ORF type:complete len:121 (+),score=31.57 GHUV01017353.1:204-566(+)